MPTTTVVSMDQPAEARLLANAEAAGEVVCIRSTSAGFPGTIARFHHENISLDGLAEFPSTVEAVSHALAIRPS